MVRLLFFLFTLEKLFFGRKRVGKWARIKWGTWMCAKCEVSRILNGAEMSQTHDRSTHQTPVCLFVSPFVSSPFFSQLMFLPLQTHTRAHTRMLPPWRNITVSWNAEQRSVIHVCMRVSMEKLSLSSGKEIIFQELSFPSFLSSHSASQQFLNLDSLFVWGLFIHVWFCTCSWLLLQLIIHKSLPPYPLLLMFLFISLC